MIVKIDQDLEVEGSKKSEDGIDSVQDLDDDFTPEFDIEGMTDFLTLTRFALP